MRKASSTPVKLIRLACFAAMLGIATPAAAEPDLAQAKATFDQMCAGCHGFRGDGQEGQKGGFVPRVPTLAMKDYMSEVPDEYIYLMIAKGGKFMGKMASMPAWEKRLSEKEMRDLVVYIRTFTGT
ncbi:MAG: cytochrome c [Burkholderiales bacterium]